MIKLLILLLIAFLGYRGLKSWMLKNMPSDKSVPKRASGEIDDIMVKDPFCEVYFPKRNGVHLRHQGADLYFCSTECKDKFLAAQTATQD